jgi:hypothetical protein
MNLLSAGRRALWIALLAAVVVGVTPSRALAGTFSAATQYRVGTNPRSAAVGDFNGDSVPDLAVGNFGSRNVSILPGTSGGAFGSPINFPAGAAPRSVAVGDFNGDSDPDLAVANLDGDSVSILLGSAGATFTGPTDFAAGDGPNSVAVAEFNGDQQPDLAITDYYGNVSILMGEPGGSFASPTDYPAGTNPMSVVVSDFNGDTQPDLAVANYSSDDVSILLGAADGSFGLPIDFPAGGNPRSIAVGDFNGDADPDLAVANLTSEDISILLGGVEPMFTGPTNFPAEAPNSVAVGDFNHDSQPDLAAAQYYTHDVTILLGAPGGTFPGDADFPVGRNAFSVTVGDFNVDSRPDLAITNHGFNTVSILRGGSTTVSIDDVSKAEGDAGETDFAFTVSLSGPNTDPVSVDYQTTDGTATAADSDYTPVAGTLTFAPGETSKTITVKGSGDVAFEPNQDFKVVLSGLSPADTSIAKGTGVGSIQNDDPPPYPRPKGATPLYVPLVVAYGACNSPNEVHAVPLAFGSCKPPNPRSEYLTVGTPDANGLEANGVGAVHFGVARGDASTPVDEADIKVGARMTDVRNSATLGDYAGELWATVSARLTDRVNVSPVTPQTVSDFDFGFAVPCVATADSATGGACSVTTTADAVLPGSVPEGSRAIWELGEVRMEDGGADGQGSTRTDNTVFLTQGVFVP